MMVTDDEGGSVAPHHGRATTRACAASLERIGLRAAQARDDARRRAGRQGEQRSTAAIDWLETLVWDGVPRIDTFFSDHFSVLDTPYTRAVGAYAWTTWPARCLEPGIKAGHGAGVDQPPGAAQDHGVIEALSPDRRGVRRDQPERKDDDIARSLRGKLVGEIAELRGLQTRDAESIKAWVSRRWEEWTPKLSEFGTRFARRLMLFGTGNKDGFLDDETGERRWLPMAVGAVDVSRDPP
jgi:predicted P-loop ATPase